MNALVRWGSMGVMAVFAASAGEPWKTSAAEVRKEAKAAAKPCVLVLNADCGAR